MNCKVSSCLSTHLINAKETLAPISSCSCAKLTHPVQFLVYKLIWTPPTFWTYIRIYSCYMLQYFFFYLWLSNIWSWIGTISENNLLPCIYYKGLVQSSFWIMQHHFISYIQLGCTTHSSKAKKKYLTYIKMIFCLQLLYTHLTPLIFFTHSCPKMWILSCHHPLTLTPLYQKHSAAAWLYQRCYCSLTTQHRAINLITAPQIIERGKNKLQKQNQFNIKTETRASLWDSR